MKCFKCSIKEMHHHPIKPGDNLHFTQYVQPFIVSVIIHLFAMIDLYLKMNLKWILGKARGNMRSDWDQS